MAGTKPLKSIDCSLIEYFAGRKIIVPKPTVVKASAEIKAAFEVNTQKPKAKVCCKKKTAMKTVEFHDCSDDDEPVEKRVRWNEKELKKIERESNSSKVRLLLLELEVGKASRCDTQEKASTVFSNIPSLSRSTTISSSVIACIAAVLSQVVKIFCNTGAIRQSHP
jgi:hypothetical protein